MKKHCTTKKNFPREFFADQFSDHHKKKHKKAKRLYSYKCHECRYWHLTRQKRQ